MDPKATRDSENMGITAWASRNRQRASSWGQNCMKLCYLEHLVQLGNNGCHLQVLRRCQLHSLQFITEWEPFTVSSLSSLEADQHPRCGQPALPSSSQLQLLSFEPVAIRLSSQPFILPHLLLTRITCDSKMLNPAVNTRSLYDLTYHSGLLHPP